MNRLLLALSASAIFSTNVMAADAASCQNVRMGVVNWTDVIATSAMTQVLLDGLGYKTKLMAPWEWPIQCATCPLCSRTNAAMAGKSYRA